MRGLLLAIATVLAMTAGAGAQTVGVTSAVNPAATGIAPSQKPKTMVIGDDIFHDEKISTDKKGLVQILLADGSSFTVGPNSTMTIDSFVYDPNAGTAQVVATLGKGAFRFIGGKASKQPDGVTLNTPVGTVGIRGGIANLDFSGATAFHVDLVYGQGVTLKDGTQIIGDIYHSGYSIVIDPSGKVSTVKTPPEWTQVFQTLMAGSGGGGSAGSVKSTEVASTLKGTHSDGTPPDGGTLGTPGTGDIKPGSTPDDVKKDLGTFTTWAEISNSDLAGVYAIYSGTYAATITPTGECESCSVEGPLSIENGAFQLGFDFGRRTGTFTFGGGTDGRDLNDPETTLNVPVAGSDPTTASFAGSLTSTYGEYGSVSGSLTGNFLNTNGVVGSGVAGQFNADVGFLGDDAYHVDGTFAGNRP
jgi:hypothetical protein